MKEERTPVEARGGVVSGRVFLVLVSSFGGAVIAVALCWAFLIPHA
jgi:nitrogen fixation protein FixH